MNISKANARAFLLDAHQDIEEYADHAVTNILDSKDFNFLAYPPNWGFTNIEIQELKNLEGNEHLKNALRKVIADASAGVVFNLLNIIDGTTDPSNYSEEWSGIKLTEVETNKNSEPESDFLHDRFYELYWEWKELRANKSWKLDIHEE